MAKVSSEGVPAGVREGPKFGESQGGGRIFDAEGGKKDATVGGIQGSPKGEVNEAT